MAWPEVESYTNLLVKDDYDLGDLRHVTFLLRRKSFELFRERSAEEIHQLDAKLILLNLIEFLPERTVDELITLLEKGERTARL